MAPDSSTLRTPWLRDQLIDWLTRLTDRQWQERNWFRPVEGASGWEDALDFFDDTGLLDEPEGRLGYVLADEAEVRALRELNSAVDRAIDATAPRGDGTTDEIWAAVAAAAREALTRLGGPSGA